MNSLSVLPKVIISLRPPFSKNQFPALKFSIGSVDIYVLSFKNSIVVPLEWTYEYQFPTWNEFSSPMNEP